MYPTVIKACDLCKKKPLKYYQILKLNISVVISLYYHINTVILLVMFYYNVHKYIVFIIYFTI